MKNVIQKVRVRDDDEEGEVGEGREDVQDQMTEDTGEAREGEGEERDLQWEEQAVEDASDLEIVGESLGQ